ncbi:DUF6889 family protein [Acetobacter sp. DsW_059]|nr:hypothetical protein [Acetobacter sp. DsW_059]
MMRPVIAGMCKMESLKDGALDLEDIALMNDALDAKTENEIRSNAARKE